MKNTIFKICCLISLLSATNLAAQNPDIDVSTTISANRLYVEFWVQNYEEVPVFCSHIRQKVLYKSRDNDEVFGQRYVRIRNITIQPGELFYEEEGGKDIIDFWQSINRYAVIKEFVGSEDFLCELVDVSAQALELLKNLETLSIQAANEIIESSRIMASNPNLIERLKKSGCTRLNEVTSLASDGLSRFAQTHGADFRKFLEDASFVKNEIGCD